MKCPKCGGRVKPARAGFIEVGEYDGKAYEFEDQVEGYCCEKCRITFWTTEGLLRPPKPTPEGYL